MANHEIDPDGPAGPQPSRADKRWYFALMAICIGLFVLSWAVIDRYSVLASVIVSAVALAIPPFAVIIANVASATDRRRPLRGGKYSSSTVFRLLALVLPSPHQRKVSCEESEAAMAGKAVISLTTGLEDPEKVTVAFLVAVGAAESGRPTLIFQAKEAVRLALDGTAAGVACDGCPALPDLLARYEKAGGRYMVCPICFNAKQLDKGRLLPSAELAGTVQLWEWIGDEGATTFSY